jgi:hypothetical protein
MGGGVGFACFEGGGGAVVSLIRTIFHYTLHLPVPSMTTMAVCRIRPFRPFEDLPADLQQFYYGESALRTLIPGRVVRSLWTLVGLPLARLRVNMTNATYPVDELNVCLLALDWIQANGSRAHLSTQTRGEMDDLLAFPARGALASARKNSIRRIIMIYWEKYIRE